MLKLTKGFNKDQPLACIVQHVLEEATREAQDSGLNGIKIIGKR
jgi:hypothetical protein